MAYHYNRSLSSDEEDEDFYCYACERSFNSHQALQAHLSQSSRHNYCIECQRDFRDSNALRNHLASKRHQSADIKCPRCKSGFVSASALTKHIEVGNCINITNNQIVQCVRRWEESSGNPNLLTVPRIGWKNMNDDPIESCLRTKIYATEASFDGYSYVCPICNRGFLKLLSLNQHLNSNAHEPSEFRCRKCRKTFRELSALVGHVESEACGAMSAQRIRSIVHNFGTMSLTNGC